MKYLYILDYESCSIKELSIKEEDIDNISKILNKYGLNDTKCNYMISDKKLFIKKLM